MSSAMTEILALAFVVTVGKLSSLPIRQDRCLELTRESIREKAGAMVE
jgi:hypothetical protein